MTYNSRGAKLLREVVAERKLKPVTEDQWKTIAPSNGLGLAPESAEECEFGSKVEIPGELA